jgi:hypothetical protein
MDLLPIGNELLDIYYRLHPKKSDATGGLDAANEIMSMKSLLKMADEIETSLLDTSNFKANYGDKAYVSVLKAALNYCDLTAEIFVTNMCFIVGVGEGRIINVLKKHKSKEDFILNETKDIYNYTQSITRYETIPEISEVKRDDHDNYSLFVYGGLKFGVEICLDHSRQRLFNHLKKFPSHYVDVQIITACGMEIRDNAVIAERGGYVFCCDGEYVPKDAEPGINSHTALKRVNEAITPYKPAAVLSEHIKAISKPEAVLSDKNLYFCEKYQLHIYKTVVI